MAYAVSNPLPWLIFLTGALICWAAVSLFHRRYPTYPYLREPEREGSRALSIMRPIHDEPGRQQALPWRVPEDTPTSYLQELFARGISPVGVEDEAGRLVGVVGPEDIRRCGDRGRQPRWTGRQQEAE